MVIDRIVTIEYDYAIAQTKLSDGITIELFHDKEHARIKRIRNHIDFCTMLNGKPPCIIYPVQPLLYQFYKLTNVTFAKFLEPAELPLCGYWKRN